MKFSLEGIIIGSVVCLVSIFVSLWWSKRKQNMAERKKGENERSE